MAENVYDLVVVGGGPAGYAGAIRAGQLDKKVACVEMERAGGTCLNWGCIPTKTLLKSAELYQSLARLGDFGLSIEGKPSFDFAKIVARSRSVSDKMAGGIEFLFKKNKVDYLRGKAVVQSADSVEIVDGPDKGKILKTKNVLIATGTKARQLPGLKVDGERVLTSREALVMKKRPESIVIVGAGAIGVEFAYFLNSLGTKVTLVEMLDQILPVEDEEVATLLARSYKKQGIDLRVGTKVENIAPGASSVKMELVKGDKREAIEAESLLLSIGVVANLDGVLGPNLKLELDRGWIKADEFYRTSVKGIYGAGDIIGPPWLAHVATYEAVQAVGGIFGALTPKRVKTFPGCTYCHPQVASVGLTEKKLKEAKIPYKVGKFPFTANGRAVAAGEAEGFIKVLTGEKYGEILGAHIVGPDATELIAEFALAMNCELTIDDIHATIHAHPTLSEAMGEAAAAVHGEAIHI
ncbi:MAG TPA: dihydrolipoyl dehydrogenase [Opitutales bacterium]|nr:dihydrolipoyl dehydrogenase [Opitutales bacterium]